MIKQNLVGSAEQTSLFGLRPRPPPHGGRSRRPPRACRWRRAATATAQRTCRAAATARSPCASTRARPHPIALLTRALIDSRARIAPLVHRVLLVHRMLLAHWMLLVRRVLLVHRVPLVLRPLACASQVTRDCTTPLAVFQEHPLSPVMEVDADDPVPGTEQPPNVCAAATTASISPRALSPNDSPRRSCSCRVVFVRASLSLRHCASSHRVSRARPARAVCFPCARRALSCPSHPLPSRYRHARPHQGPCWRLCHSAGVMRALMGTVFAFGAVIRSRSGSAGLDRARAGALWRAARPGPRGFRRDILL